MRVLSTRNRWLAAGVTAGLVMGSSLVVAGPAFAAPGDASASGVTATVALDVAGLAVLDIDAAIGNAAVTGAGNDADNLLNANVAGLLTAGAATLTADSDATGSTGSAQIAGANVSLFGAQLLATGDIEGTATCAVGAAPVAAANAAGVVIGNAAAVNVDGDSGIVEGDVAIPALAGLSIHVAVSSVETETDTTAAATGLRVELTAVAAAGSGIVVPAGVFGTVLLAQANCESLAATPITATNITPNTGPTTGGQTVTITGTGFGPATTVDFNGVPATNVTPSADGTSLTAVTPAGTAGPATVTVANPGAEATLPYEYVAPSITGLTPNQGPAAGNTPVTIVGTGLGTTTGVTVGGAPAQVISVSPDGTQIQIVTPAGTGLQDVVVTIGGGSTVTAPEPFLYVSAGDPQITNLSPGAGPTAGGTTVIITGTNLADVTEVLFGTTPGTIVGTPTDTQIVVTTPPGAAGAVDVTLSVGGGAAGTRLAGGFLYVAPPTTDTVSPGTGPIGGGTIIRVGGSGFVPGATTVTICGITIPATAVTVNADGTSLSFTAPACAAGVREIVVTTPGGSVGGVFFTYLGSGTAGAGGGNTLASTGAEPAPAGFLAAFLLLAGAAVAFATGRKRRGLSS